MIFTLTVTVVAKIHLIHGLISKLWSHLFSFGVVKMRSFFFWREIFWLLRFLRTLVSRSMKRKFSFEWFLWLVIFLTGGTAMSKTLEEKYFKTQIFTCQKITTQKITSQKITTQKLHESEKESRTYHHSETSRVKNITIQKNFLTRDASE